MNQKTFTTVNAQLRINRKGAIQSNMDGTETSQQIKQLLTLI